MQFYTYDLETMNNYFSFTGKFRGDDRLYYFEISTRVNQRTELLTHLDYIRNTGAYMVGYNSLDFDYPITHQLLTAPHTFSFETARDLCARIIGTQSYGNSGFSIGLRKRIIPQIDLVKVNHFDNNSKRTSLKALQFAMRSASVEDLPFDPNEPLTFEQMDQMKEYNAHDVLETEKFLEICIPLIEKRKELLDQGLLFGDVLNFSDVKIGKEYLINKIGRTKCFVGSKPRQSVRQYIRFSDTILPKISFDTQPFNDVLEWFKAQTYDCINSANNTKIKLKKKLAGIEFVFGVGGVHASVESKYFESNDEWVIKDIDVSGMYPAVAIANGFYPEHLGKDFITHYEQLQHDRRQYTKGTTMNAVLKLAGNGVYGNSNNVYSCFYDPRYTFSVTVNGQLQLCQLVEHLSLIPSLRIIQANTDGVSVYIKREHLPFFNLWRAEWEKTTKLVLEEVTYSRMWIRDVNNYTAETTNGKIKRKGAYWWPEKLKDYEGWWNKDFSSLVVQKSVDLVHRYGITPEEAVHLFTDPFDFMLRYKTSGAAKVFIGSRKMLKTVRYYASTTGEKMYKKAPPKGPVGSFKRKPKIREDLFAVILAQVGDKWDERIHTKNQSVYAEVVTSIQSDRLVKECNVASRFNWDDVDYQFYVDEIKKLIIEGRHVQ